MVPAYKGEDRLISIDYRRMSLSFVVWKEMEHVITGYIRQVWETGEWLYEG